MGWLPSGEEWTRSGRGYLTERSQHAREVQAKQLGARAAFLEAYGYPDGHEGLTFRQVLEVLAAVQGGLSAGQTASIKR
eukprot:3375025-Heterocapsa_arctica.AAC.1